MTPTPKPDVQAIRAALEELVAAASQPAPQPMPLSAEQVQALVGLRDALEAAERERDEARVALRATSAEFEALCSRADAAEAREAGLREALDKVLFPVRAIQPDEPAHRSIPAQMFAGDVRAARVASLESRCAALAQPEARLDPEPDRDPATLRDLLSLVEDGLDRPLPSVEEIAGWDDATHDAVSDWAASVYLRASDHDDVEVPPLPAVLNQPERSSVPPATPEGWDPQGNEAPDAPVYDPEGDRG